MNIKFTGPVFLVEDMAVSRKFYEEVLGQKVTMDLGLNVAYEGGLALWQREHAYGVVFGKSSPKMAGSAEVEMVFETAELDEAVQRLEAAGVKFAHPMVEMPWAQRVARFYDPDGHLVEVGEPMDVVVRRYLAQGLSAEETAQRTFMPLEVVRLIAGAA